MFRVLNYSGGDKYVTRKHQYHKSTNDSSGRDLAAYPQTHNRQTTEPTDIKRNYSVI